MIISKNECPHSSLHLKKIQSVDEGGEKICLHFHTFIYFLYLFFLSLLYSVEGVLCC